MSLRIRDTFEKCACGMFPALHCTIYHSEKKKKIRMWWFGCLPSLLASQAVLALQVHQVAPEKKDTGKNSDK